MIIDIVFIAFVVLGLIFGLIGKAPKKIFSLVVMMIAILTAYFTCNIAVDKIKSFPFQGQTLYEFGMSKVTETLSGSGINIPQASVEGLINGLIKLIAFWALAIVLIIVFAIIGAIISAIAFHKAKEKTAFKTIGLFGAIKGFLLVTILIVPLFVLNPVLKTASSINESLAPIEEQAKNSKVLNIGEKVVASGKLSFTTYEVEVEKDGNKQAEKRNLYNDINSLPGLLKVAKMFTANTSGNPMEALASMNKDDIREMFNNMNESDTVKEIINGVASDLLKDTGIDLDLSQVDLSKEADTFIAVIDVMGEIQAEDFNGEISEETQKELIDAICTSDLVVVLAETQEGMLNSIDQTAQNEIKNQLQEKVNAGDMDQENYDAIMKLFKAEENNENNNE